MLSFGQTKEALDFYEKSRTIYEQLLALDPANANAQRDVAAGCYHAACGFARLSATDKDGREADALRAIDFLRQAIAKGYKDLAQLKQDKDLDALRKRTISRSSWRNWRRRAEIA